MIMPFETTWMDLESIMLSEISQRKTNTSWFHTCNLKHKTKQKQTHGFIEQTVVAVRGGNGGMCKIGEGDEEA